MSSLKRKRRVMSARFKKGIYLMSKSLIAASALVFGVLTVAPGLSIAEPTVHVVEQQIAEEASNADLSFSDKALGLMVSAKDSATSLTKGLFGTDERIERKDEEIRRLRQELVKANSLVAEKRVTDAVEYSQAVSCTTVISSFLTKYEGNGDIFNE